MLYGIVDVHFFFLFFLFFPPQFCPAHISGTVTRRDSKLSVLLGPAVQFCTIAYHPIRFVIIFFFFLFFFFAKILSGSYLWNRYSQRLQIECAAWFCGLVLHYCLPSNSIVIFYFLFFSATILSGPYLWNRYSQRLQIECAAWFYGLVLHYHLPSNSLCNFFFFFFFFFRHDFVRAISLEPLLAETPN